MAGGGGSGGGGGGKGRRGGESKSAGRLGGNSGASGDVYSMRLQMDFSKVRDKGARSAFEQKFKEDIAKALGVDVSRVEVLDLQAGSIIVSFRIKDGSGKSGSAAVSDLRSQISSGGNVMRGNVTKTTDPKYGVKSGMGKAGGAGSAGGAGAGGARGGNKFKGGGLTEPDEATQAKAQSELHALRLKINGAPDPAVEKAKRVAELRSRLKVAEEAGRQEKEELMVQARAEHVAAQKKVETQTLRMAGMQQDIELQEQQLKMGGASAQDTVRLSAAEERSESAGANVQAMQAALKGDTQALVQRNRELESRVAELRRDLEQVSSRLQEAHQEAGRDDAERKLDQASLEGKLQDATAAQQRVVVEAESDKRTLLEQIAERKERVAAEIAAETKDAMDAARAKNQALQDEARRVEMELSRVQQQVERSGLRRQNLMREFEQLRMALQVNDAAEAERLSELEDRIQDQKEALSKRHTDTTLTSRDRLVALERQIRMSEEAKWSQRLGEAQRHGEVALAQAKVEAETKYKQLVQVLTDRFTTEYKTMLEQLERQRAKEEARAGRLEGEVASGEQRERDNHTHINELAEAQRQLSMEEEDLARERSQRLDALRNKVHLSWSRLCVPVTEQVAFLRRVDEAAPYNEKLAHLYEEKAAQLSAAAPIINLIKRRESVLATLQGVQRYLKNPLRARADGTAAKLAAAGFDLPKTEPNGANKSVTRKQVAQKRQQLARLKQKYAANARDLRDTNMLIERSMAAFREGYGAPFTFRGLDYTHLIAESRAQGDEEPDIDLTIFMQVRGERRRAEVRGGRRREAGGSKRRACGIEYF